MAYQRTFREMFADNWKFWLVALSVLILGLSLSAWNWEKHPLHITQFPLLAALLTRILPKLGEALMIASILALVIDGISKRKLLDEFLRDISIHILGRLLPRELREHMLDYLSIDFVRSDWTVTYTITSVPGRPDYVQMETYMGYDVENRSALEQEYSCKYDVEESWFPDVGESRITWAKAAGFFEHVEGDPDFKVPSDTGFKRFSKTICLPPFDERRPVRYKFEAKSIEFFKNFFQAPFLCSCPVMNFTLTIYYPKDLLDLNVYFSYSGIEEGMKRDTSKPNRDTWIINKPLLPGQGFFTRWEPKQKPEQAEVTNPKSPVEQPKI